MRKAKRTNGHRVLHNVDGRYFRARRYKEVRAKLLATLPEPVTTIQQYVAGNAAGLQVQIEVLHEAQASGEKIDTSALVKACGLLRRLLRDLSAANAYADDPDDPLDHYLRRK